MGRLNCLWAVFFLAAASLGCEPKASSTRTSVPNAAVSGGPSLGGVGALNVPMGGGPADADSGRKADVRLLFIGNSHTAMHDLPGLVRDFIRAQRPGQTVYAKSFFTGFLEDAARDPSIVREVESGAWTAVVLQAQKISMSGRANYSRAEGIDLAIRARAKGAKACFFPEWGLKGKPGDGDRQEKVYREMAQAAEADCAPVATAWDLALAARPELQLHSPDGNHQSALGAFLTGCVLYGALTGESPAALADYPYAGAAAAERRFLAEIAAEALKIRKDVAK